MIHVKKCSYYECWKCTSEKEKAVLCKNSEDNKMFFLQKVSENLRKIVAYFNKN